MSGPSIDDYRWLTSEPAAEFLTVATEHDPLATIERLRRQLNEPRARLVAQQLELRRRASRKFSRSDAMFFTARGLEQATGEAVARYKARRFANYCSAADLCCGIGGDLVELASRPIAGSQDFETLGVDNDPILAILATANAKAYGESVTTRSSDARSSELQQFDAWHIDPDRRIGGTRTTDVTRYAPDLAALDEMLAHNANAAIKLAPAVEVPDEWQGMAEVEWISHDRECRQAVAWFGGLLAGLEGSEPGRRRATRLDRDGQAHSFVGHADQPVEPTAQIRRFVYEPDPAVLAAKLDGDFARHHKLNTFSTSMAYLTADHPVDDALLACFSVVDVLPFDVRKVKSLLQSSGVGRLEVKRRGVDLDPNKIARQLKTDGSGQATLILARVEGAVTAIIAERVVPPS